MPDVVSAHSQVGQTPLLRDMLVPEVVPEVLHTTGLSPKLIGTLQALHEGQQGPIRC